MSRVAIFASGGGSNAHAILEHFSNQPDLEVVLILSNVEDAGVFEHAAAFNVPTVHVNRTSFYSEQSVVEQLREHKVDWIALAGFLWLVPPALLKHWPGRIVNIHPALLPDFGGKGMYGMHVHRAVKAAGRHESGISIHLIDEVYDRGSVVFQARVALDLQDDPRAIAAKVLRLEHAYYPKVLAALMRGKTQELTV